MLLCDIWWHLMLSDATRMEYRIQTAWKTLFLTQILDCNNIIMHPCNDIVLQPYIDASMQWHRIATLYRCIHAMTSYCNLIRYIHAMTSYCNRISIHPCNDVVLQSYIDSSMQWRRIAIVYRFIHAMTSYCNHILMQPCNTWRILNVFASWFYTRLPGSTCGVTKREKVNINPKNEKEWTNVRFLSPSVTRKAVWASPR